MACSLRKGMTLAVEPMIAAGRLARDGDDDEWCFRTRDRQPLLPIMSTPSPSVRMDCPRS